MAELVLILRPTLMWPQDLPGSPDTGGYSGTTPFQGIRSSTDSGIDRVRATSIIPRKPWKVSYILDRDELAILQSFATLATGHYFLWPHPLGDHVLLVARFLEEGSAIFQEGLAGVDWFSVPVGFETQQNVTFQYTDGPWPWR